MSRMRFRIMQRKIGRTSWRWWMTLAVLGTAGCAHWRGAAQKSSGRPLSFGISGSVPLGR